MSRRETLLAGAGMLWSLAATTRGRADQSALVTEAVAPGIPMFTVGGMATRLLTADSTLHISLGTSRASSLALTAG